ncbi:MAG: PH domain-containing protein [Oscillochloris sp.]|nr:PH domain-containing protein [Oscillochloris sp.]
MLNLLRRLLRMDAEDAVDLNEGEEIRHVTGRHWIVLLVRLIVPVAGIVVFGGLAFYRSIGGGFLAENTGEPVGLDLVNWFLIGICGVLLLLFAALWVRRSKDWRARWVLTATLITLGLVIYFRYLGGRMFYVDPSQFYNQGGDLLNITLIILAAISGLFVLFVFYDWLNDELILTNQRVVYDNDQVFIPRLLERRVQEQIFITDVQDVVATTKTYPQHWLKYGTVIVKSARLRGELKFDQAIEPQKMQKEIMAVVNTQRKERGEALLERLIETKVYNAPAPRAAFTRKVAATSTMRAMEWLVPENPEFDEDKGTYTWRAHWLFLVRGLIGPIIFGLLGAISLLLLIDLFLLAPGFMFLGTFLLLVVFVAWTAYEIEDYRNDLYILNPTNVIDIEKKPFGPESRRQASLGAINNVSFETTFVSNLLGYGDVILETAGGGGKFTFPRVPRPRDVVATINDYYVSFKNGEKEKNLNDTLELLRHYHLAQQRHDEIKTPSSQTSSS